MTATEFQVNEVFDIAARGGLVVVGAVRPGEFVGVPSLYDKATGNPIRVLGVDHPTPRTTRTGETILVVDRADADYAKSGRLWTTNPAPGGT
ncbi:hypothetical protein GCM10020358_66400 [Amorphoplanes nipponensis]|uniref:Uncharacterized protein n=1 Tax=Actinoplanes nipponensis TaxID=135950 RepID=A0A919MRM7_9ACTN|nr:hypothetical protein [Actinoplanes nipponensis]GIE51753.1 hypothetical protein Ani05nite_52870 [Actinoplanes nipponensis]